MQLILVPLALLGSSASHAHAGELIVAALPASGATALGTATAAGSIALTTFGSVVVLGIGLPPKIGRFLRRQPEKKDTV